MKLQVGIEVVPVRERIDHKGTIWEHLLLLAGWYELPKESQFGTISEVWKCGNICDVHFQALNHTAKGIFEDEIKSYEHYD